ncbi:hypothetical protein [Inquilinus sp.]|jgi:hypothetical protein|uniref:hypothetical protein n=1 Tax=Inquilinus sp. TaxID=1932117 RepID=UPI0037836509
MNSIEIALGISRINGMVQAARVLSRGVKDQVRTASMELILLVRGMRQLPVVSKPIMLGVDDLCALHAGYVEMLEGCGANRVDIVTSFNKTLRGLPAKPGSATIPTIPNGHVLVRTDALQRLAGGEES